MNPAPTAVVTSSRFSRTPTEPISSDVSLAIGRYKGNGTSRWTNEPMDYRSRRQSARRRLNNLSHDGLLHEPYGHRVVRTLLAPRSYRHPVHDRRSDDSSNGDGEGMNINEHYCQRRSPVYQLTGVNRGIKPRFSFKMVLLLPLPLQDLLLPWPLLELDRLPIPS